MDASDDERTQSRGIRARSSDDSEGAPHAWAIATTSEYASGQLARLLSGEPPRKPLTTRSPTRSERPHTKPAIAPTRVEPLPVLAAAAPPGEGTLHVEAPYPGAPTPGGAAQRRQRPRAHWRFRSVRGRALVVTAGGAAAVALAVACGLLASEAREAPAPVADAPRVAQPAEPPVDAAPGSAHATPADDPQHATDEPARSEIEQAANAEPAADQPMRSGVGHAAIPQRVEGRAPDDARPRPPAPASPSLAAAALARGDQATALERYRALAAQEPENASYALVVDVLTRKLRARCGAADAREEGSCR